jgi:phage tail-like protein
MKPEEFKTQIFKTPEQWESGLLYRLEMPEGGGISLYSTPTFAQLIQKVDGIKNPEGLAVDECGQIYFIDKETCRLFLYDPGTKRLERITSIGNCDSESESARGLTRILIDKFTLWVLDAGNHKVMAFSRENFQIKYVIDKYIKDDMKYDLKKPVGIGLDDLGNLYVLDKECLQIFKYDSNGLLIKTISNKSELKEPIGLAVGKGNYLFVIDGKCAGFLRFTEEGDYLGVVGDFTKIEGGLQPSAIAVDKNGNIFVGDKSGLIHQFDPDGSYIGKIQIPGFTGPVEGLAADLIGNLYASGSGGIALLSSQQIFTKENGIYYSKTLDSGIQDCQWHLLALEADIPPKTIIEVYYHSSNDPALKTAIDGVLSDPNKSTQKKAAFIDNEIGTWIGPEKNPRDMLFRIKTGRYLWLKLVLSTFDEKVRPAVREMRLYYPRISYLRYLPATYQEDPISKDFLERFLSIFETVFYGLEIEISRVFRYFDPDTTPESFLTWLSSWLNLGLEEGWPEDKKREFILQSSTLYKIKGTPSGIRRLIEIYTGKTPLILEHSRIGKPMVVGADFKLGVNSLLIQTPVRGFRLGDDSILGKVALRDTVGSPEDPFLQIAHRFTIILDLSGEEFARYEKGLTRILDEGKPAHTIYTLRIVKEMRVGIETYVEISTRVAGYSPIRLGVNAAIGSNAVVMGREQGGVIERHSRLEKDTELI